MFYVLDFRKCIKKTVDTYCNTNFLTLNYSLTDTRKELKNALLKSNLNVNESSDSDTLEVIKVTPQKRKRKNKIAVRKSKRAKKTNSIYSDLT